MSDLIFSHDRLAPLYDAFGGGRDDLPPYLRIIREFGAQKIIDVGCGTGNLAHLASAVGYDVLAIDPAEASLRVARSRPHADHIEWHHGTVESAPPAVADIALMTGNVAQVFLTDAEWLSTLRAVYERLRPGGHLVFEARRPEARAWESWSEESVSSMTFPGLGLVRSRRALTDVSLPYVSFTHTYDFPDGEHIVSDSTLRFREEAEHRDLLSSAGFSVDEVRQAPDRPGKEFVFIARTKQRK